MQPAEIRPRGGENLSVATNNFAPQTVNKVDLQGASTTSDQPLQALTSTFKGTVRALIDLKRLPRLKVTALTASSRSDDKRSAVVEVPRISATAASNVQSQVQKLVADGHVVAELDPTSGTEVTYRYQGNLDHYTEDNLAKRLSLQQHPHMIALTQRLWSCALRNGETKLTFTDYETYMLCLHRLVLPDFDIAASKELILDDWKRDCGDQDYLDYSFFHLSMFELVDLWTDTVDSEDYISLLYCISHCLTYLLNERLYLKALEDVSNVDVLEQSKGVTLDDIDQDLQRELTSDAFAYHRDQIKFATEAKLNEDRGSRELHSPRKHSQESKPSSSRPQSRGSHESGSPRRQSQSGLKGVDDSRRQSQSGLKGVDDSSSSRAQERRRSSLKSGQKDEIVKRNAELTSQHRYSRSGSSDFDQNFSKRKKSVQANKDGINSISHTIDSDSANAASSLLIASNLPTEVEFVSTLRTHSASDHLLSPTAYSRDEIVLGTEMIDNMTIATSLIDSESSIVMTSDSVLSPRRASQSRLNSSQYPQDDAETLPSRKDDRALQFSERQAMHIEALVPAFARGTHPFNAFRSLPIPDANKSRKPFTVRAAAVAEAAANITRSNASITSRRSFSAHRTLHPWQQHTAHFVRTEAANETLTNGFIDNSSLTAPLMTIYSSKVPSMNESQERHGMRLQTPYGSRYGVSISASRASLAITAQSIGLNMTPPYQPVKPLTSPLSSLLQRPSSLLNSDRRPSKLQSYQQPKGSSLGQVAPNFMSATVPLTINGRKASTSQLDHSVEASRRSSIIFPDGTTDAFQSIHDFRASGAPRYVITEPVPVSIATGKQFRTRPRGSTREFLGMKGSPRNRHRYSNLMYSTATSYPRRRPEPRYPSELAIVPKLE